MGEALAWIESHSLICAVIAGLAVAAISGVIRFVIFKKTASNAGRNVEDGCATTINNGCGAAVNVNYGPITFYAPDADATAPDLVKPEPIDSSAKIALRLREVLATCNRALPKDEQIDVVTLAKLMPGNRDFGAVESYFNGSSCPTFEFLHDFSHLFGVNPKWLESGTGSRFLVKRVDSPQRCLDAIGKERPRAIYFALCLSERKQVLLILQTGEYRYCVLAGSEWPLALAASDGSPNVGAAGQADIVAFFQLIQIIYGNSEESERGLCNLHSLEIPDSQWVLLEQGDLYAGSVLMKREYLSHWADDIRDLDWRYCGGKEHYLSMYGDWFIATQEFIKSHLNRSAS